MRIYSQVVNPHGGKSAWWSIRKWSITNQLTTLSTVKQCMTDLYQQTAATIRPARPATEHPTTTATTQHTDTSRYTLSKISQLQQLKLENLSSHTDMHTHASSALIFDL